MKSDKISPVTTFVHNGPNGIVHIIVNKKELEATGETVRWGERDGLVLLSVPFDDLRDFVMRYVAVD
jgi:hypothetical protein